MAVVSDLENNNQVKHHSSGLKGFTLKPLFKKTKGFLASRQTPAILIFGCRMLKLNILKVILVAGKWYK